MKMLERVERMRVLTCTCTCIHVHVHMEKKGIADVFDKQYDFHSLSASCCLLLLSVSLLAGRCVFQNETIRKDFRSIKIHVKASVGAFWIN